MSDITCVQLHQRPITTAPTLVSIFAGLHLLIDLDSRGLPARLPAVFLHQAPEGECGEARPRLVLYRGEEFLADTDISILTSASKSSIRRFVITEKAPTRAFS